MSEAASAYKLECYQIKEAMGSRRDMWRVEDQVTGECFVMRKLPGEREEIYRILEKIRHPALVGIMDVFCYQGSLYVIEEFVEGETLAQVLAGKGASEQLALSAAEQVLGALCVLHGNGIIHRDIKPENIMLDRQGRIRLIDLHIARLFSEEKDVDTTHKGTRAYAPPEQYGFGQTDRRADIYSLGVTVNELAAGRLPEEGVCGGPLESFVRRCTELDPKRRYQTAEQALAYIKRLEKWRRSRVLLPAAALGLTAVVGLAAAAGLAMGVWRRPAGALPDGVSATFEDLAGPYRGDQGLRRGSDIEMYPSIFLEEDGIYDLVVMMEDGREAAVTMEKEPDQLVFSCALEGQEPSVFHFDDALIKGSGQGFFYEQETYLTYDLQYEILSLDYDEDGDREFVVLLGRGRWIVPSNPAYAYLNVGYSLVWFIDLAEDGTWSCCQEPYWQEGTPTFAYDMMICDPDDPFAGYKWIDGEWTYVPDPY